MVWYALFIFYADGTTDAIKICNDANHIDYFNHLRNQSLKFASICEGIGFEIQDIQKIIYRLGSMDAFIFLNFHLKEILNDYQFVYRTLPSFKVYGRHIKSFETYRLFEEFICCYDLSLVGFQQMNEQGYFQNLRNSWVDPEAMHMYLKEEYQLLKVRSIENESKE